MDSSIGQTERESAWLFIETMNYVQLSFSWNNIRRGLARTCYHASEKPEESRYLGEAAAGWKICVCMRSVLTTAL